MWTQHEFIRQKTQEAGQGSQKGIYQTGQKISDNNSVSLFQVLECVGPLAGHKKGRHLAGNTALITGFILTLDHWIHLIL